MLEDADRKKWIQNLRENFNKQQVKILQLRPSSGVPGTEPGHWDHSLQLDSDWVSLPVEAETGCGTTLSKTMMGETIFALLKERVNTLHLRTSEISGRFYLWIES